MNKGRAKGKSRRKGRAKRKSRSRTQSNVMIKEAVVMQDLEHGILEKDGIIVVNGKERRMSDKEIMEMLNFIQ